MTPGSVAELSAWAQGGSRINGNESLAYASLGTEDSNNTGCAFHC